LIPSLALSFVVLTRFDGVIFATVLAFAYALRSRQVGSSLRLATRPLQASLGIFVLLSVLRLLYVGNPIPLSVNAKTTNWIELLRIEGWDGFVDHLSRVVMLGGAYIAEFLAHPAVWILWGFFAVALVSARELVAVRVLVFLVPVGAMTIAVLNWGDWMPGFRLLTPFLGVMAAFCVAPISRFVQGLSVAAFRASAAVIVMAMAIAAVSGAIIPGGVARIASLQLHRSYEAEARAWGPYWEDILEPDEVYVAARGGALPYSAPALRNFGYHGLFDECIGRSGYKTQGSTGKRNWACVFRHPPAVLDANNLAFARGVAQKTMDHGYPVSVALCGTDIRLTGQNWVFFIADWKIPSATKADANLVTVPLELWMENPDAYAQGEPCDPNPQA
jgi:hypothetical protein